jgi:uncharacterized protein (TIGR02145 family)
MNRFFALLLAASCLTAVGQCDAPYIPPELFVLGCCTEVLIPLPEGYEYQINGSSVTEVVANGNSTIQLEWSIDVPFEVAGMSLVYMSDSTIFAQSQDILTWEDSRQDCLSKGGHLATFSSQLENEAVFDALPFQKGFIGLFQNTGSSSFLEPSGGWEWVTGEPLEYSFWRSGEPNNQVNSSQQTGGEDFGEMQGNQGGRWNDIPSYGSDYYVCEFSLNASTCSGVVEVIVTCLEGSPDGFCGSGTQWDAISQTCIVTNPSDSNFDGCVQLNDLLDLLSAYGDCGSEESPWQCGDPLQYQGYDYETVQIGDQCWFAENLKALEYRDGNSIEIAANSFEWQYTNNIPTTSCKVCASQFDDATGDGDLFYNFYCTVNPNGLCPVGWSVPTIGDFESLLSNVAGQDIGIGFGISDSLAFGLALQPPTWVGSNELGFGLNPLGGLNGSYWYGEGEMAHLWSSTMTNAENEWAGYFEVSLDGYNGIAPNGLTRFGRSVRCIKDAE